MYIILYDRIVTVGITEGNKCSDFGRQDASRVEQIVSGGDI